MNSKTLSSTDVKVYTKKELAKLYEVDPRTFNNWIKPHENVIGKKNGRFFTIPQVKMIFDVLGVPSKIIEE